MPRIASRFRRRDVLTQTDLYEYHEKQEYPSHKGAIAGLLVVFGAFVVVGVYSLMELWSMYESDITSLINMVSPLLADNLWMVGAALGVLLVLSIILALGASVAAKRLGGTLIYIGAIIMNALTWAVPLLLVLTGTVSPAALIASWPILIPGIFTLFITLLLFTVFKDRVRRAGEIIKLTGQVTLDEKGTFVPPFLTMIFTLVSALFFAGIMLVVIPDGMNILLGNVELTLENGWPFAIGVVVYLFVTIFFYNFAYSTTSAITYIYMRGRDPTLGDGVKASLGVIGALIVLSIMSVIVTLVRLIIRAVARRSPSAIGRGVGYAAEGAIGWVWALVNYFTIPAMVAEDLSATKGIKRSAGLVRRNFVDVIIKETAVRWGFGVLAFMFFIGFALGGALFGWFYTQDISIVIVFAFVFIAFAAIPSTIVLRTFDIVYVTLLYVFIRRKEGDYAKTAIPSSMGRELESAYNRAQHQE
ncbi:MAG: hypothetical protein EAX87_11650 [Candidatus Thorarchaeota archaeon]|nr:hypothetical protein [Candidatus Thorarchaeota archaeon]